jgi:hypothetical protein
MYPLIIALGEKLWTPKPKHDINSAKNRVTSICKQGAEYGYYDPKSCEGV